MPLVGIVIGQIAGLLAFGVAQVAPHALAVAVAYSAIVVLTGAIHIDGFLDASDALFASVPAQRRLEIMKDPRHGTYAVAGFVALSAVWIASIASLPPLLYPGAFAFAGGAARWAMTLNAYAVPYARDGAFRETVGTKPAPAGTVAWAAVFCATGFFVSPVVAALVPLAALCALGLGRWARGRLDGGLTGDVYGFGITVLEVALLACVATVQASTWAPRI